MWNNQKQQKSSFFLFHVSQVIIGSGNSFLAMTSYGQ